MALKKEETSDDFAKVEDNNDARRVYAAISFVVVLIVIGLPLWWETTDVYRVPLPYSRIAALDSLDVTLAMNISITTLDAARGDKLIEDLKDILKTSKLFQFTFRALPLEKKHFALAHSPEGLESGSFHPRKSGELFLLEVPGLTRFTPNHVMVGLKRTVYFSSEATAVKLSEVLELLLLREKSLRQMVAAMTTPTETDQDRSGRRRMPAAEEYDIMMTVVNPEPEKLQIDWDLPEAVQDYLEPFLYELSPLAGYTVKSQWLYFVTLNVQPKLVIDTSGFGHQHYALAEDLLPQIITPLEKKLASRVSRNPCLNFVVYIPPCEAAPLHIYTRQGVRVKGGVDAFLSPRWGGIVIHNPSHMVCHNSSVPEPKEYSPDTVAIMGVFLAQLRLLMGIPELEGISRVGQLPLSTVSLRQWEFDSLLRMRTLEQLTSAKLTLQSLSQLLGKISNIVINDAVGNSIYQVVDCVERAAHLLKIGQLDEAFNESKKAFLSAEAAFTDPSLLALLYFPDDQKYAVYIPLFLPVMIPVVMSLKNICAWFSGRMCSKHKLKKE
ncbi:GPI transamidase component PIG-S isoform X2 [Zootermopsis nevadensis]|uniref:GPI transamidase component PIG-S n=1 Tax=Zootermopsis nevadensis TaxID=136037 RepID=A0A067QRZ5_ZOONE|nr:GPI transamidase component PIG-S isoform X2 [Zootermopsis nevadensis]KDR07999.1 GPI transamidase component PIG-S [Zootermopsis nevadensis]